MRLQTIFVFIFLCIVSVKGYSVRDQKPKKTSEDEHDTNVAHKGTNDDDHDGDYNDDKGEINQDDIPTAEANIGQHYFQGDILSTHDQLEKFKTLLFHDPLGPVTTTRALIKDVERTWTNGLVPYVINRNVGKYGRKIVNRAIAHWQKYTCLRFINRTNEEDYVEFERGSGCASYVGRIGGNQSIVIGNKKYRCRVGNIIHEIGHTIGFFHEQSRPDRDKYVRIRWRNILRGYRVNFVRFSDSVVDSQNVPYDYGSIMHYPRKIFARDSKETVIPAQSNARIGQRRALSASDLLQANKLYGCSGHGN